ncbi:MAG: hypothetical protein ACFFDK_13775 [Promethearchaeota archaeon]
MFSVSWNSCCWIGSHRRQCDIFGSITSNYHTWMKAIKYEFDLNNASDPGNYTEGKKFDG